jgi:hypothetical protein
MSDSSEEVEYGSEEEEEESAEVSEEDEDDDEEEEEGSEDEENKPEELDIDDDSEEPSDYELPGSEKSEEEEDDDDEEDEDGEEEEDDEEEEESDEEAAPPAKPSKAKTKPKKVAIKPNEIVTPPPDAKITVDDASPIFATGLGHDDTPPSFFTPQLQPIEMDPMETIKSISMEMDDLSVHLSSVFPSFGSMMDMPKLGGYGSRPMSLTPPAFEVREYLTSGGPDMSFLHKPLTMSAPPPMSRPAGP